MGAPFAAHGRPLPDYTDFGVENGLERDPSAARVVSRALYNSQGLINKHMIDQPQTTAPAFVYILRLLSGAVYVGCTKNIEKRFKDHLRGKACQTTFKDPPVSIVYQESCLDFSTARKREAQIKKWSRAKKEALITGDIEMLKRLSKARKPR